MLTRPTSFPFHPFSCNWLNGVSYERKGYKVVYPCCEDEAPVGQPASCGAVKVADGTCTEQATADLSAKKVVYIKDNVISENFFEGSTRETWVPLYRKKENGEATFISFTCSLVTPLMIPFSVVYHALRLVAIPFLLLYRIGKCVYDMFHQEAFRTRKEVVWDHFVQFLDDIVSPIWALIENVFWRVCSCVSHIFGFFEGWIVCNPRIGRRLVAWCECLANRKVSLLGRFKTLEGQKLSANGPDRSWGASLYYAWWSILGPMTKFECLSFNPHAFFLAGCFMPYAIGVLNDDDKVVNIRDDNGKLLQNTKICDAWQKPFRPFCC